MKTFAKYVVPLIFLFPAMSLEGDKEVYKLILVSAALVYYLYLGTDNKQYLKEIAIPITLLPIVHVLFIIDFLGGQLAYILAYLLSIAAFIFYFLRFWNKPDKWSIYQLSKLLAVFQLAVVYPFNLFELSQLSLLILGLVYFSTRIFQLENLSIMVRSILFGLFTLVCIFFIVLAQIQAAEANKQAIAAMESQQEAQELQEAMGERMREFQTELNAIQAQLDECQSGKKELNL